ncbi:hypothetical protein BACI348_50729 [Bacillus altitudinis]|uniref:Uncharacterized protein n=1 Tax=Bacillus altitudinis TaxID=293387 RepID=A0A653X981_BACAB|nr:hypothetical protein BACI9J_60735 [Bacillus altitudinis]VXC27863.1 hypothetical protein BACI348_50729 [Bacillus altitudinis]
MKIKQNYLTTALFMAKNESNGV